MKPVSQQASIASLVLLAHGELDVAEFYQAFLATLPVPSGTTRAVVWLCLEKGFRPLASWPWQESQGLNLPIADEDQGRMLGVVASTGDHQLYDLSQHSPDPDYALVAILPVRGSEGVTAIIEVFFASQVTTANANQFLTAANMMCGVAAAYHEQLDKSDIRPNLGQVASQLHKSLRVDETAYAIANEGRRITECDRVSVLVRRGDKYRVRSVSGQESVNPRANAIQSLQHLVERTAVLGEPFWHPTEKRSLPPEIEMVFENYLEVAMCRTLGIIPMFAAKVDLEPGDEVEARHIEDRREPIAVLVIEQFTDVPEGRRTLVERSNFIAEQGGIALGNAVDHESVFLLPLWRWVGGFRTYFQGRRRIKTLVIGALAASVLLALCLTPTRFRIASEGTLQPTIRSNVFAPLDGTVETLHVQQNDSVTAGQPLMELRSDALELEIRKLQGELLTLQTRIDSIRARRLVTQRDQDNSPATLQAAAAEEEDLRYQIQSVRRQLDLRESMSDELVIRSPIAGRVVTWDVKDLLLDRPVTRGQLLVEVVDSTGEWTLELELPDRRIAHVLRAKAASDEPLPVSFILASDPGQKRYGNLIAIEQRTNASQESGQFVRVTVEIEQDQVPFQQPGTKVQAKIDCGSRPIIYVWLHDIWEFVQTRILFRIG